MNRKTAKDLLPIIKAFSEGKCVETKTSSGWISIENMGFVGNPLQYRIKPESTYRPFKDADECWQEMLKHQPFGWTRDTHNIRDNIKRVTNSGIVYDKCMMCFENVLNKFQFIDGTPFGVKVEE